MNKPKRIILRRWGIAYGITIFLIYLAGYLYWQWKISLWDNYYSCWIQDPVNSHCVFVMKPDGPLSAMLSVVIPFVATVLFILVALVYYRLQKPKQNKNWGK